MGKKLDIEFIRVEFAKEGYELLTQTYDDAHQKLEYICPRDHKHSTSWTNWNSKRKPRCPYCDGQGKLTIEFIRTEFAKEDYILLTKIYKNSKQRLKYICPRGCRHSISWNAWQQGERCSCYVSNIKLNIEFIRAEFAKEGYILLTTVYENAHQKLEYICPRGHRHSISWANWNSKSKSRCPKCNDSGVSKWEKMVRSFFIESDIDYTPNDRTQLINPKTGYNFELDIWFPDLNKAIECNGVYWHSLKKVIAYDKIKKQLCKDQGIDLLVITDKEWKDDIDKYKAKLILFVKSEIKTCHVTE
jgi:hypothetical protein